MKNKRVLVRNWRNDTYHRANGRLISTWRIVARLARPLTDTENGSLTRRVTKLFTALFFILPIFSARGEANNVVIEYTGKGTPEQQNWTRRGSTQLYEGQSQSNADSASAPGVGLESSRSWEIRDDSRQPGFFLQYTWYLGNFVQGNAMRYGWALEAEIEVMAPDESGDQGILLEYADSKFLNQQFRLQFGADDNGDPIVRLNDERNRILEGFGPGPHHYKMSFNSQSHTVDLYVDDAPMPVFSGIKGVANKDHRAGLSWGAGPGSGTGHARFKNVKFSMIDSQAGLQAFAAEQQRLRDSTESDSGYDFETLEVSCVDPKGSRHRAYPGMARLQDDRLLLVYKQGTGHWENGDFPVITYSSDDGKSWTAPAALVESSPDIAYGAHNGPAQLEDGTILIPYMSYAGIGSPSPLLSPYVLKSVNNGETWTSQKLGPIEGWTYQNTYGRVIEIGKEVWLSGGGRKPGDEPFHRSGFFVSYDSGRSWPQYREISTTLQDEKDIVVFEDRILAMIRSGANLYKSYSKDTGKTWSKPQKTFIHGQGNSLLKLPNGHVLMTYRQVAPGTEMGLGLAVSRDQGQTWDELGYLYRAPKDAIVLVNKVGLDCGYSSMIMSNDPQTVLIAYYTSARHTPKGQNNYINVAKVRLVIPD